MRNVHIRRAARRLAGHLRQGASAVRHHEGQTMAEYALLLGVIALVVLVVALTLGSSISSVFTSVSRRL
jgi:Flp pilus assembly pilin Flp